MRGRLLLWDSDLYTERHIWRLHVVPFVRVFFCFRNKDSQRMYLVILLKVTILVLAGSSHTLNILTKQTNKKQFCLPCKCMNWFSSLWQYNRLLGMSKCMQQENISCRHSFKKERHTIRQSEKLNHKGAKLDKLRHIHMSSAKLEKTSRHNMHWPKTLHAMPY